MARRLLRDVGHFGARRENRYGHHVAGRQMGVVVAESGVRRGCCDGTRRGDGEVDAVHATGYCERIAGGGDLFLVDARLLLTVNNEDQVGRDARRVHQVGGSTLGAHRVKDPGGAISGREAAVEVRRRSRRRSLERALDVSRNTVGDDRRWCVGGLRHDEVARRGRRRVGRRCVQGQAGRGQSHDTRNQARQGKWKLHDMNPPSEFKTPRNLMGSYG